MKRILLVCLTAVFTLAGSEVWAQEKTISGKVTSAEDGSALPGVNVVLKGSTNGSVTDATGNYALSVPQAGGTLIFTFIGLKSQEVEIGTRTTVDIQMAQDVQQLSEVLVTAQGIERTRNELPYAAQKVNGEDVSRTRDANFINSLSGKVAGVQITRNNNIGGSTNIVVRGFKSLTGTNQALFVVDGVPIDNSNNNTTGQMQGTGGYDYGNAAADINPDDIESINILKGAAATALYGSRASNGVILITTKKGRKGLGVTINTGVTVGSVDKSTLPKYQKEYGAGYGQYYGPGEDAYFNQADVNGDGIPDLVVPTYEDASMGGKFDPNLNVYQWDAFDKTSPNYGKATPWVAAANDPTKFFEHPVSTNNSVNIDGGSDRGYFKLGYTRNDEKGIMPNSNVTKDFVNFSASYDLTSRFKVTSAINFSNISGRGRYGTGYDGANGRNVMTSFRQWYETNVDIKELKNAYFRSPTLYGDGAYKNITWNWANPPSNLKPIYWDNPYWVRHQNYETDNRSRYFGNVRLDYKITDWLSAMGRISLDSYDEYQEERIALGSVGVSSYSRFNRSFREHNYDAMLNFNKDLSRVINLRAVLGTNIRRTTIQSIRSTTNGGLSVPDFYSLSNTVSPLNPPTEIYSDLQVNGYYANATVGIKKFLFVDLAYRRDVASSLPKGKNGYNYGSASTSFVFSELIAPNPTLTVGKIRLNYAEVGNTAPTNSLQDFYDKPTGFGSIALFSIPGTKNNADLKPERTKNFEAGLEMAFLDSRVGFDATYYKSNTVDQIIPLGISTATGYNSRYINAGNVENKGVELTAFVIPVKTDNFSWNINVNWTRNRNVVKEIFIDENGESIKNLPLGSFQGGVSINGALGQPYGTLRGTDYVYDDKGQKLMDDDGRYQISANANEVIGNINPKWIGGIMNTFKYKNISLSFLIDMKRGGDVFSVDMYYGLATGLYRETAGLNENGVAKRSPVSEGGGILLPGVKASDGMPNDVRVEGDYDAQGYTTNPNKAFVYDASYTKLREVNLTYSIPAHIISKLAPFKGIDVSLLGRNLWIIHKNVPYADPEDTMSSGNIQGVQIGSLPNTKTMGFNVKLRF
jgi:TonB-linked SusC/RagA family outer membrane protein